MVPSGAVRLSSVLAPRDREFFDLFEEAGGNILRAAGLLEEMLQDFPERSELARDILICEQDGDRITHDIIQRLNQTFVTPIDREVELRVAGRAVAAGGLRGAHPGSKRACVKRYSGAWIHAASP